MNHKVVFIFLGNLSFQVRLQRFIDAVMEMGLSPIVIYGRTDKTDKRAYNFEVVEYEISYTNKKINSFFQQLKFNFFSANNILKMKEVHFVQCWSLITLLGGVFSKIISNNIKLIFDCTELSVETFKGIKKYLWFLIQKFSLPYCDFVIQANHQRAQYFQKHYNILPRKMVIICNFPKLNKAAIPTEEKSIIKGEDVKLIYIGGISDGRGLTQLVKSIIKLKNVSLDLIGPVETSYRKKIEENIGENKNIKILLPIYNYEITDVLKYYNIGIAFYENNNLNQYYCAPNKVYDYINNGLPVITNDYPGLVEDVMNNKVGICVSEISTKSISEAINKITSESMKNNITPSLRKKFSWESQEIIYKDIFH